MAAIGDVLVKFVADFAEFSAGMKSGQQALEDFGKTAQDTNAKLSTIGGLIKTAVDAFAVTKIVEWVKETAAAADEQEKLAKQLGFTADQIEAMQKNAKATGQTFDQNTAYFKTHRAELDAMTAAMKSQGDIMSGTLRTAFADVNEELEKFGRTIGTVRASFQGGTLDTVVGTIAKMIRDMGASLAYFEVYKGTIQSVRELMAIFTGAGGLVGVSAAERAAQQLDKLKTASLDAEVALQRANAAVKHAQEAVPSGGGGDPFAATRNAILGGQGANTAQTLADAKAAADAAQQVRDQTAQAVKDAEANIAKAEKTIADAANPPAKKVPTVPTGGGAGGATDADTIDKQIARYKAMGVAADEASKKISAGYDQNIEDLLRQVKAQQTAADIVAKLEANHQVVSEEQKKLLEATVLATENKIAAEQKLIAVETAATETQKKYGDGTVALTKLNKDIANQLDTHRINQTEATRATKEGTEAINQAALAAARYDDNLGSLAAGFEHAANAYARQNDLFSSGEQLFSGLTTAMSDGLKALEGQSSKTFGQIALDFANMLADMALKAAVSQVFKAVFGSIAAPAAGSGVQFADVGDLLAHLPGKASGGPVSAGQSYVVGEQGPELFVPTAAGNIVPNGAASGGSGDSITVNVDMNTTQGAPDPANMLQFGRQMKAAIKDVIQNEKRPGGSLYSRVSG